MFGSLGGPELFLILVVALIVFGPRKLPEIGKSLGKMMAEFRKASNDFRRTIEEEVEADKLREATRIDMSPVTSTAASAPAPEVAPAATGTEPAATPPVEPAASGATEPAGSAGTEPAAAAAPGHDGTARVASESGARAPEPALTVSREAHVSPEPVEPK